MQQIKKYNKKTIFPNILSKNKNSTYQLNSYLPNYYIKVYKLLISNC